MRRMQTRRLETFRTGGAALLCFLLSAFLLTACGRGPGGSSGGTSASGAVGAAGENAAPGGSGTAGSNSASGETGPSGGNNAAGGTGRAGETGTSGKTGAPGGSDAAGENGALGETGAAAPEQVPLDMSGVPAVDSAEDCFTIFVYMVGSDLESYGGAATADLQEMREAVLGSRVQLLILTGGATQWAAPEITGEHTQLFRLSSEGFEKLADLGLCNMGYEKTLEAFLRWGAENVPSGRRAMLFWNHGGGTMMGFGRDEHFPHSLLSLPEMAEAVRASGMRFSFVGFDACLMGTLETAKAFAPFADYLIASEETEPGSGWSYTRWLTALGENPDMDIPALGKLILDDYIPEKRDRFDTYTLSLVDLSKIDGLYAAVKEFFRNEQGLLKVDYRSLSRARNSTRAFGNGMFEQIDLVNFLDWNRTRSIQADAVRKAVDEAVVDSRSTVDGACGIAIYFPYKSPDLYEEVSGALLKAGFEESYFDFYDSFMNTMIKGREATVEAEAVTVEGRRGVQKYQDYQWYDPNWEAVPGEAVLNGADFRYTLDPEGYPALSFTEEQRSLLTGTTQRMLLFDSSTKTVTGLGWYLWDAPGGEYYRAVPHPWPTINGQLVTYFELSNEPDYEYGMVPCVRNGKDFETLIIGYGGDFLKDGGECELIGLASTTWEELSFDAGLIRFETAKKGAMPLKKGDSFRFIRYDLSALDAELAEGEDGDRYVYFGDPVVYDGNWDIRLKDIFPASGIGPGGGRVMTQFLMHDIYQNAHKSELLSWLRAKDGEWYYDY